MFIRVLPVCAALAAGLGCGEPPAPEPAAIVPAAAANPPAAIDEAQMAAVLHELTQAVRKFGVEQRSVPKSLEELVSKGYLSRVPQAPAGKKFAISKDLQVHLAD